MSHSAKQNASQPSLAQLIVHIIQSGQARTQQQITEALQKRGRTVNQSSISRLLRKIGAVKSLDALGEAVYRIPQSGGQIGQNQSIKDLVRDITSNEQMILIHTRSGCANVVAQLIDEQNYRELLGTLAGDNTILLIPSSIKLKTDLERKTKKLFDLADSQ